MASLLKRKKAADLLRVTSEAWLRPESQEAIKPQLAAAAADDGIAEAILDEGIKQSTDAAHGLTKSRPIDSLDRSRTNPGPSSTNKDRRLEKLLHLQRLILEQNPNEVVYLEVVDTLRDLGNYADATRRLSSNLLARVPERQGVRHL